MSAAPNPIQANILSWRVIVPFVLTGTIWGSTWFVITGQIDGVPAAWSVFYRFALATPALFLVAMLMKLKPSFLGRIWIFFGGSPRQALFEHGSTE